MTALSSGEVPGADEHVGPNRAEQGVADMDFLEELKSECIEDMFRDRSQDRAAEK